MSREVGGPSGGIVPEWEPRAVPLEPVAVAAVGPAARALARRLLLRPAEVVERLSGVTGPDLLLLLGEELPWTDGAVYLGRDPAAPTLLLPTTLAPSVPIALLERRLARAFREVPPPVAVLPQFGILASAEAARAVSPEVLRAWLGEAG